MIKPWPIQEELAKQGLAILLAHHIVYYAMEERTGKTLCSIRCAEQHPAPEVLVITKKKALEGWQNTLSKYITNKPFTLTTYTQVHKLPSKLWPLVILDEAHYLSGYPKPSETWKVLKPLFTKADIIFCSATPYAQGPHLLYHQLALSTFSPWLRHRDFYGWHRLYGKPYSIEIRGISIPRYDRCIDDALTVATVEHLFITKTRKELGFEQEPEDVIHFIELDTVTKEAYNYLVKRKVIQFKAGKLVCESSAKLRASLHMLEGGVTKINDNYIVLANDEKIRFIKRTFGDTKDVVIMYHYIAEGIKLRASFKNATILQGSANAEGVDLSHFKHLIVYSQDWSTAKHSQRRARQANKARQEEIKVHFLLVKKAISSEVYKATSKNKVNYIDSLFERNLL